MSINYVLPSSISRGIFRRVHCRPTDLYCHVWELICKESHFHSFLSGAAPWHSQQTLITTEFCAEKTLPEFWLRIAHKCWWVPLWLRLEGSETTARARETFGLNTKLNSELAAVNKNGGYGVIVIICWGQMCAAASFVHTTDATLRLYTLNKNNVWCTQLAVSYPVLATVCVFPHTTENTICFLNVPKDSVHRPATTGGGTARWVPLAGAERLSHQLHVY